MSLLYHLSLHQTQINKHRNRLSPSPVVLSETDCHLSSCRQCSLSQLIEHGPFKSDTFAALTAIMELSYVLCRAIHFCRPPSFLFQFSLHRCGGRDSEVVPRLKTTKSKLNPNKTQLPDSQVGFHPLIRGDFFSFPLPTLQSHFGTIFFHSSDKMGSSERLFTTFFSPSCFRDFSQSIYL